uniref:6-hydroxymethylpterin diphosphokinase MptE-like domain-containing protein n=1 Tax=Mycolicibacterium gilvum (strain PYR-GCK) TaxID=350054 RepID=A4TF46_MYCGI|nr:hypothetical protein Mflv_4766 [Mycolicibacterium gilvum PYR-GCK]
MSDAAKQQIIAQEQGRTLGWKRRAATALLGENAARTVAARLTDLRAVRESSLTAAGRANRSNIKQFKNSHAGERCVIIGNGPSLKKTDLSLLSGEITFGLNRIYLMFDELGFETTFHVVVNQLVVEQCADDFRRIQAPLFTTTPSRAFLDGAENVAYLNKLAGPRFSRDASHGIWEGATVTYVAMQLAYYMGFSEVVLIGVDHRFAVTGPAHQVVESAGPDASHFDPNYFGKGFKWQLPDLETSELAYHLARKNFESNGRKIVDATVDGALTVFPKVRLEEALGP